MNATRRHLTVADLRMEMVARLAAAGALFLVAAAFTFSFAQITWVSAYALQPERWWLNLLLPFVIDVPSLISSSLTVALHNRPFRLRLYAWMVLILFTTASWTLNAVHAVVHSSLPPAAGYEWWAYALVVVIAGFPPVGVVLGVHLWAFALRHSATADQRADLTGHLPRSRRTPHRMPHAAAPAAPSMPQRATRVEQPVASSDTASERDRAREVYEQMRDAGDTIVAAEVRRRADVTATRSTVERWVKQWRKEDEIHAADPADRSDNIAAETHDRVHAVG